MFKYIPPSYIYYCDSCGKPFTSTAQQARDCPFDWSLTTVVKPNTLTETILLCDEHTPVAAEFFDKTLDAFSNTVSIDQKISNRKAADDAALAAFNKAIELPA